jgi:hypothetical protein
LSIGAAAEIGLQDQVANPAVRPETLDPRFKPDRLRFRRGSAAHDRGVEAERREPLRLFVKVMRMRPPLDDVETAAQREFVERAAELAQAAPDRVAEAVGDDRASARESVGARRRADARQNENISPSRSTMRSIRRAASRRFASLPSRSGAARTGWLIRRRSARPARSPSSAASANRSPQRRSANARRTWAMLTRSRIGRRGAQSVAETHVGSFTKRATR